MRAVIFDVDGTLLQSASVDDVLYRQAVQTVLGPIEFRQSLTDYDYVTDSGILEQVFQDNKLHAEQSLVDGVKSCFGELVHDYIRKHGPFSEYPGARKLVRALQSSNSHFVAIATGGWRQTAVLKLETAGFDLVDIPLTTSDESKDRLEIMQLAIPESSLNFESITYFGDGTWDRDACRTLGWEFVAVGPDLGGIQSFHDQDACL